MNGQVRSFQKLLVNTRFLSRKHVRCCKNMFESRASRRFVTTISGYINGISQKSLFNKLQLRSGYSIADGYMYSHFSTMNQQQQISMNATQSVRLDLPESITHSCGYIEYIPGDLNVIISAPHGGNCRPASIPDRDAGAYINGKVVYDHQHKDKDHVNLAARTKSDIYTTELSLMVAQELLRMTGRSPHVIINKLYRAKMDANCDMEKATFNVEEAKTAWYAFHEYIEEAKLCIGGPGLFIDVHGQSHKEGWVELGYTLSADQLDAHRFNSSMTSLRNIAQVRQLNIHELICGADSFGSYLQTEGYTAVPSPANPSPAGKMYYAGGYNTERHGSKTSGQIDSIQVECPRSVRYSSTAPLFAKSLANSIYKFLDKYYYNHQLI